MSPDSRYHLRENRLQLAVGLNLTAFFLFATLDATAKWLVEASVPALQVAFFRYFFHFVWVLVLFLPRQGSALWRSAIPAQQIFRGSLLMISTICNFTALIYLPLTVTTAMFNGAPLVICLLSMPVLGEKVGIRRLVAVLVGFCGVLIIIQPWGTSFDWHILYAVAALLGASGYFLMSRITAGIDSNPVSQFYGSGVGVLVLAPMMAVVFVWPANAQQWLMLVMLGALGMLGHSLLTIAHRFAEASTLAPAVYSQLVYMSLFSWYLFDTPPTLTVIVGSLIIVASGLYIWFREQQISASAVTHTK